MQEEPTDVTIIQLTQRERPADRFLASNVHALSYGKRPISFISMVEIIDAWNPARELGVSIPQTFVRLFASSEHQSILTKFEDALKGINKLLADHKSKLSSPVNCLLALVADDEVYLASVGEVSLLLLRNGRLSHLSADLKDGSHEFTTVTSGELTTDDWLFVTNLGLGQLLENTPISDLNAAATNNLEEFLTSQIGLENPRVLAGGAVRYAPESGQLTTIYLDELESRTPIALPKFALPKFKLPVISLAGLAPFIAKVKDWAGRLSPRQWLLIGLGLVIVIALLVGVARINRGKNQPVVAAPTLVSQLADLGASDVRQFAATKITASSFDALSSADQTLLQNMLTPANITVAPLPKELATLPATIVAIDSPAGTAGELYLIDTTGQLWKWAASLLTKIEQKQLVSQPIGLVAYSATKILVTDVAGNIWLFDGSANQPVSLSLPTKLATGPKLLQKYKQNLYIYSSSDHQIYRITNFDKDISAAAVTTKADALTNAPVTDWAINGDIFTINAAGTMLDLRKNLPVAISTLPPLIGPFQLAATENSMIKTDGRLIDTLDIAKNTLSERVVLADQAIADVAPNNDQGWWVVINDKLYLLP